MVSLIERLAAGNALRVFLSPPPSAVRWKLLRARVPVIPSHDWTGATLVHSGTDRAVMDTAGLVNGEAVHYRAFYLRRDGTWEASDVASQVPEAGFVDVSCDALSLLRERLFLGLSALVQRGELLHESGAIPVLTASPDFEGASFPLVTVHLASDLSSERFVGDAVGADELADDGWHAFDGFLSRVQITVIAWALNADERLLLRRAVKAVLLANVPIFSDAGMQQLDMQFSDQEDFSSYAAPVYQAVCAVSCTAPSVVRSTVPVVADVSLAVQP